MTLEIALVWVLRLMGVIWIIGGVFVIQTARTTILIDRATDKIERLTGELGVSLDDQPVASSEQDRGRDRWLLIGGILTLVCGAGLVASSRLVLVPLTLLVVHQGLYARRQWIMSSLASNEEDAEEARMTSTAQNGAITAVVVWLVVGWLTWWEVFT